jgi:WD40 repeat protein
MKAGNDSGLGFACAAFLISAATLLTAPARVWSADGQGEPMVLKDHGDPVVSASFIPDGKRVVTASQDGTARVWGLVWTEVLQRAGAKIAICLTVTERMRYLGRQWTKPRSALTRAKKNMGVIPPFRDPDTTNNQYLSGRHARDLTGTARDEL